jgi:hypothetical protein
LKLKRLLKLEPLAGAMRCALAPLGRGFELVACEHAVKKIATATETAKCRNTAFLLRLLPRGR